jgi:hypothetical protein
MRIASLNGIALRRILAGRRRRVSPQADRALEILGHAIEYLTDELIFESEDAPTSWRTGLIDSIQLLVEINRLVYFECPESLGIKDRSNLLASEDVPLPSTVN